jgi:hypothetical protein
LPNPGIKVVIVLGVLLGLVAIAAWQSSWLAPHGAPIYSKSAVGSGSVWTWDGSSFTQRTAAGPHGTSGDMAYDRKRGVMVLWDHGCDRIRPGFDGGCRDRIDGTWTWDGTRWSRQSARSSPAESGQGVMLYDEQLQQVVYVNGIGQAWAWRQSTWASIARDGAPGVVPPGAPSRDPAQTFAAGYDSARGVLVYALSTTTWTWDGRKWAAVDGGVDYGDSRPDPHLVYDGARRQLVYVGARSTWTWDGTRWQKHDQPVLPPGTAGYDAARQLVTYVAQNPSACDDVACRTDTWTWDGVAWTRAQPAHPALFPLTRSGSSPPPMAYDDPRHVLVMFIGAS